MSGSGPRWTNPSRDASTPESALRRATGADATAIAHLHIASWQAAYRGILSDAFLDSQNPVARAQTWEQRLAAPEMTVLLDEGPAGLLGFCACGPTHDADADPSSVWEIYNLHVTPARRGGGIGSRLFAAAGTLGRERRAHDLTLWVVDRNVEARRFYEHKGMTPDGAHQVHTVGLGAALAELRYRLQLTRP